MKRIISLLFSIGALSGALWANEEVSNLPPVAVITETPNRTWLYHAEQVVFNNNQSYDQDAPYYITEAKWYINGVLVPGEDGALSRCFVLNGSAVGDCIELAAGVSTVTIKLSVKDQMGDWDDETKTYTIQQHKGRKYFLTDHIGNVRATVNRDGNVLGYDDYYPFGKVMQANNTSNPNDNYKFTGHERDTEASLSIDYMNARTYDPVTGMFMQRDPLEDQFPGWTPYHYVHNNPLNFTDPTGMEPDSGEEEQHRNNNRPSFNDWNIIVESGSIYDLINPQTYYAGGGCPNCKTNKKSGGTNSLKGEELPGKGSKAVALPLTTMPALTVSPAAGAALGTAGSLIIGGGLVIVSGVVLFDAAMTGNSDGQINGNAFVPLGAQMVQQNLLLTREGASKNEKHGGHGLTESEVDLINNLETQMQGASKKEKNKLKKRIENVRKNAQRRQKGEEHSRTRKGN